MHSTFTMMALAGVAGLFSAAPAPAEEASCSGASFSTCAAARVTVSGSDLSVRIHPVPGTRPSWGGGEIRSTISFEDRMATTPVGKHSGREQRDRNEREVRECRSDERTGGLPRQRIECPIVVTPEPISMTLMATGLVGMSGLGWMRRRKRSTQP